MKTILGRFRFIVFGVIVVAAVVSCCNYAFVVPGTIVRDTRSFAFVDIGTKQRGNVRYAEWKDEVTFENALKHVRSHMDKGASYCLCVIRNTGDEPQFYDSYNKCPPRYDCPPADIRTVKVTKSKVADGTAAGGSTANDPNITYRITSPDPRDISEVLAALKQ
jgi:hypothetical protein